MNIGVVLQRAVEVAVVDLEHLRISDRGAGPGRNAEDHRGGIRGAGEERLG